jgi:hypothetical protein
MISCGLIPSTMRLWAFCWLVECQYDWVWMAPRPGMMSLMMIAPAWHLAVSSIQEAPALPICPGNGIDGNDGKSIL